MLREGQAGLCHQPEVALSDLRLDERSLISGTDSRFSWG